MADDNLIGRMMKECNCDMRTKLVGDGCAICNPERAAEYAMPEGLSDEALLALMIEADPDTKRIPPGVRLIADAIYRKGYSASREERDALAAQLAASDAALQESRRNDMESMRQVHELAAQNERMREALSDCVYDLECLAKASDSDYARPDQSNIANGKAALSLHAPDCLKERDARIAAEVLREAAKNWGGFTQIESGDEVAQQLRELAAAKERGE